MTQQSWLSRHGVTLIAVTAALALAGVALWLYRPHAGAGMDSVPASARSTTGWEIRYNATLALARRGSDKVSLDELREMLDEDQQIRNFTVRTQDNREAPDEQAARTIVVKALEAVTTLHQKQPRLVLHELNGTIEKLTHGDNLTVREKAQATLKEINP